MNTQTDHEFVGTTINHEREPHCCGCFVIHWNAGEPIAVCNECNHTVDLLDTLAATGKQQVGGFPWENFPAYLIDKCEGGTISEEGIQRAVADMAKDSRYATVQQFGEVQDK